MPSLRATPTAARPAPRSNPATFRTPQLAQPSFFASSFSCLIRSLIRPMRSDSAAFSTSLLSFTAAFCSCAISWFQRRSSFIRPFSVSHSSAPAPTRPFPAGRVGGSMAGRGGGKAVDGGAAGAPGAPACVGGVGGSMAGRGGGKAVDGAAPDGLRPEGPYPATGGGGVVYAPGGNAGGPPGPVSSVTMIFSSAITCTRNY